MGSNTLWTAKEAAQATDGKVSSDWRVTGVSIDSRTVQAGDLFIAIKGDNSDGHAYAADAIRKGAVAAVVSEKIDGVDDAQLLIVEDTFRALQDLGRASRARTAAAIVGITGSVGKTGTKEFLATAFGALGQTHASVKSYNNHWGVPFALSAMHAGCDYGIFEMGMNHAGEITPLSQMVQPDIAIITTIAPVHVGNFESGMEGIAAAKAEILDGMKPGSKIILNKDNEWFPFLQDAAMKKGVEVYSFGEDKNADARIVKTIEAANGSRVSAVIAGEAIDYPLQIAGRHIAVNSLAVLLAVKLAGGDMVKAAKAISRQEPIIGRGKREELDIGEKNNPVVLIDESYNANPAAMRAAFRVLALVDPGRGGRRIAVLGDMLELGADGVRHHAELALPLKAANVDLVYTCGKLMKNLHDALPANQRGEHKDSSVELARIVPDVLVPGDVVMVKGSLGSKMGTVVEALRALPEKVKKKGQIG
ncbi:MAG TPA: UDP-N-acetylmuramoylalanyl-D-glutamyl-2,6-diaminopimelate--D-alanyl-D-alanine ligase [Micavibrio sp.]|nr:UDP-N-acetylmuramoylalanyl-D-glutamyl-2,6-diaminopimelate--D-alanyl-D-alanine ligase [Micavibrio sp.]